MSRRGAAMATALSVLFVPALAIALDRPAAHASFRVVAARSALVVEQGAAGTYELHVEREPGFRRALTLDAWRLPRGAHAVWTLPDGRVLQRKRHGRRAVLLPAHARQVQLQIRTRRNVSLGRFRLRVSVMARHARSRHWLTLSVRAMSTAVEPAPVTLSGRLAYALRPGASAPVELTIGNPRQVPVTLTALQVAVDDATSTPGCSGAANYAVRQFAGYPLVVPPGSRALRDLVADPARLPRVEMLDLPVNQDACKGAAITLRFKAAGSW